MFLRFVCLGPQLGDSSVQCGEKMTRFENLGQHIRQIHELT